MSTTNTLLKLIGIGITPYSVRGATQTLSPIDGAANLRRTVNGELRDLHDVLFEKYQSTISCSDQQPPALEMVWPGKQVEVWCAKELAVQGTLIETTTEPSGSTTEGVDGVFSRPAVPGSIRHSDGFTFYRPILTMRVTALSESFDEWAAATDWSISLEEV